VNDMEAVMRYPTHNRRKRLRNAALAFAAAILAAAPQAVFAKIGLSTQFVDVVFEGLKPGRSYNVRELRGVPYTVKNRGDGEADVLVEAIVPEDKHIKAPYEPIPDPSWIVLTPDRIKIGPNSVGFSDIIVTIPDDPALEGKHFQAMFWAHTVNTGMLAAGVKSRFRFSIGPGPDTLEKERRQNAMVTLNYDLWPTSLYVKHAKAGKRYDVKRKEKKTFKLTNRNDERLELVPKAIPWPATAIKLPHGYETVQDLSWVEFKPGTWKVKGGRVKDMRVFLNPPKELAGKKIAFVVQLALPIGTPVSAVHRMFVTVEE